VEGHQQVARMERSAIRERAEHQAPAPDFAEPVIGRRFAPTRWLHPGYFFFWVSTLTLCPIVGPAEGGTRWLLAMTYNRLTSRWIGRGKPVDECQEKPVHLSCGS
jgi:hypothetical protein